MRAPRGLRPSVLRLACAAAILAPSAAPAFAADPPKLPADAKRISGAAIARLYDGKTFSFESFTFFGIATGTVTYDFASSTNHVTYTLGAHRGTINGRIRVVGDRFCYLASPGDERCNAVYLSGTDIYEVRPSGIVDSVKRTGGASPAG